VLNAREENGLFVLETARLILRDFIESDYKAVFEYASDPEVVRYLEWGPDTEEQCREALRLAVATRAARSKSVPRTAFGLAIVIKAEQRLIGTCGIHITNAVHSEGQLGFVLDRKFWGQGYASEAARALATFGFANLKLHRIIADCHTENAGSVHVLEKLGMQREGRFREHKCKNGQWYDSLFFAMLEKEFKA
jgi:RimJ/RimL family protein N-acetyltransferase